MAPTINQGGPSSVRRVLALAAVLASALVVVSPASPARTGQTCTYFAGSGSTRIVIIIAGASRSQCTAFAGALRARPFNGHVSWPMRCHLISPSTLAVMGVLTPNTSCGRAVCSLALKKGWIR